MSKLTIHDTVTICDMFSIPIENVPDPDEAGFVVVDLPMIGKRSVHVSKITLDGVIPYIPDGEFKPSYTETPEEKHERLLKEEKESKEREKETIFNSVKKYFPNTTEIPKIGDIFCCSWGWEQTNIDWYKVVGMTKSGKSVRVRQLESNVVDNGNMSGISVPSTSFKGNIMTKRVKIYNGVPNFKISEYATARAWDGKPKSCSWYA